MKTSVSKMKSAKTSLSTIKTAKVPYGKNKGVEKVIKTKRAKFPLANESDAQNSLDYKAASLFYIVMGLRQDPFDASKSYKEEASYIWIIKSLLKEDIQILYGGVKQSLLELLHEIDCAYQELNIVEDPNVINRPTNTTKLW